MDFFIHLKISGIIIQLFKKVEVIKEISQKMLNQLNIFFLLGEKTTNYIYSLKSFKFPKTQSNIFYCENMKKIY